MKKVGLLTRERIIEELTGKIKDSRGYFFVGFNKVCAFPLNILRNNLRNYQAQIFVTKNSLFKRALVAAGHPEDLNEFLDTETGVVFIYGDDAVGVCKVLVDFAKETETLNLKGGVLEEKKLHGKELVSLSKLPSREALLGMAVSAIAAPLTSFLNSMNQVILKFIWVVEEIKNRNKQ